MGLPEGWTRYGAGGEEILSSHRYRALGNAIALPCAEYIMAGIAEALTKGGANDGKEASNRKQEIDRQHYTIPNQRPKDKHCGKI